MKTSKKILVSFLSCVAIAFCAVGLGGIFKAEATSVAPSTMINATNVASDNLFDVATISNNNYIYNQYSYSGTIGGYISKTNSNVNVNSMSNMPVTTTDINDAVSYAGAKLTLSGTTTLDLGVVNLSSSAATDTNALIGVVPSTNFLGARTPADSTNPYLGMYYTFRSTVNPEKYFEIAMVQVGTTYKASSTGISYNGTNLHYGQSFGNAGTYYTLEAGDRIGMQSYRFDGSMPVKAYTDTPSKRSDVANGRVLAQGDVGYVSKPFCYNYPVKIYYDYATKKFYQNAVHYGNIGSFKNSTYQVTGNDSTNRFLLFDASTITNGKGYSTSGSYSGWNSKKAWVDSFTAEEAASVAVTLHVDWNPAYTGTTDIILTDFAGQAITESNASTLRANSGTVGVLKDFTNSDNVLTLQDGHKVMLSDNDLFTKLVEFEVYPEKVGTAKATNESGLFEVKMSFTDGTDTLDIMLKDFAESGTTYRNCYTLSVNGETKWALGYAATFSKTEYGFPIPYHFDKLVRYPASSLVDQNYDRNASNVVYDGRGTSTVAFAIYYNAADNCIYTNVGRDNSSTYITTTNANSETIRRWKIGDLGSTYSDQRTAFAGFGSNLLDFSMSATLVSGTDSVKIRLLELDGQKLSTGADGNVIYNNVWDSDVFYAPELPAGKVGTSYTVANPTVMQSTLMGAETITSGYTLAVKNPSNSSVSLSSNSFTPTTTGRYTANYTYGGNVYPSYFYIYENAMDKDSFADCFEPVGLNTAYVKNTYYGEFTTANYSGGGVMVETRNKTSELVDHTETSNTTNPLLLNFDATRYPVGVTYDGTIDISDNTASDTLIELAFPGTDNDGQPSNNWQARGFKVMISDASNPNIYIALFIWAAWGNTDATGGNPRVAAAATWEKTSLTDPEIYINDAGYDNGSTFTKVSNVDSGDGFTINDYTNINLSRTSANTIKVQFDNSTGKLYVNGALIRSFKDVSANSDGLFTGFTDNKVKLSAGVVRTTRGSTDEFTRFCIMNIDGISFKAQNAGTFEDMIMYNGDALTVKKRITDTSTGKTLRFVEDSTVNVHTAFTSGTKQPVGYLVNENLHNISELSEITMNSNKTYALVYADFNTQTGANIRVSGYTGLRFAGIINGGFDSALDGIVEYGMIMSPTDYIVNTDFTVEDYVAGSMQIIPALAHIESDDDIVFYITLANIQAKNIARNFSVRTYVKVTFYDSTTAYFYSVYDKDNHSRNAYDLANSAYDDSSTTPTQRTFLVNNYINKVVDVNSVGVKANDRATYTISSTSLSGDGTIRYITVSGANGARCLVYDGAKYGAGSGSVTGNAEDNYLAMYEDSGNLSVAFLLPTRDKTVSSGSRNIISSGSSDYSILIPENASKSEINAAEELQKIIADNYTAVLPIVTDYDGSSTKFISLGDTKMKKDAGATMSSYAKVQGGFKIKSYGNGVVIYSEDDYALYYGIYRFLEENFGYKYYAYDCQVINSGSTQQLKVFDYEDYPDIRYRSLLSEPTRAGYHVGDVNITTLEYTAAYINMHLYDTASRYALNSTNSSIYNSGIYGSEVPPFAKQLDDQSLLTYFLPYNSDWDYYATGLTYGDDNPGWYVVESGTVKQICFSKAYNNDNGMYDIILNKLTWLISNNPQKTIFEIGIGDNSSYCTCSACTSGYSTYGKPSGVYLRFVNKLANDIKVWQAENCPLREIYLMAYAYKSYTVAPNNIVAADNVIVRICPLTANYGKALNVTTNTYSTSIEGSTNWKAIFNNWKSKAVHLAIWDYRSDFRDSLEPFAFWKQLANNLSLYKDCGVMEVFSQGISGWTNNVLFPFAELDDYVRSRMMWDTSLDYTTLRNDFIEHYYGAAASYVKSYITKLDSAAGSSFTASDADLTSSKYSSSWVSTVKGYFTSAYSAVSGNATIIRRLDYLSLFYRYLQIKLNYSGKDLSTFKTMCANLGIVYAERGVAVADLT